MYRLPQMRVRLPGGSPRWVRRRTARRAAYIPFTNAIPQVAVIDPDNCILCGRCVSACPTDAVVLDQQPRELELRARLSWLRPAGS